MAVKDIIWDTTTCAVNSEMYSWFTQQVKSDFLDFYRLYIYCSP